MANIGVRYAKWAPISAEPSAALPQYGDVEDLGALVSVADTPNFNDVKQYGDDVAKNTIAGFKDCTLACEVTEMEVQIAGKLFDATYVAGASSAPGTVTFKDDDAPPYGGFGFIASTYTDADGYQYRGIYYPKVKAVPQGKTYQTKGDSIAFVGDSFQFTAIRCNSGVWKEESEPFATEAAAQAWVDDRVKKYTSG
jgi:hypothetical protein